MKSLKLGKPNKLALGVNLGLIGIISGVVWELLRPVFLNSVLPTYLTAGATTGLAMLAIGHLIARKVNQESASQETLIVELEQALTSSSGTETLGMMTAGFAHNLNNYLTVIEKTSSMIAEGEKLNRSISKAIELQGKSLKQATGVMQQVLMLVKKPDGIYGGASKVRPVNEIVADAVELAGLLLHERKISIEPMIESSQERIELCEISLMQTLINLIKNAAEASEPGSKIEVSTKVEHAGQNQNNFCISVKDQGYGMTPEQIAEAFVPYKTTKSRGTGLGLLTSKRLVQRDGGAIEIASKIGEGTEVQVKFPLH
ncbi:MAG: ATP-binding protein [Bdellovibrionales bacterium]|nr:ATP-binding protein [Bdellovibrionales bacterium]